jgi:hypothetical protein
MKHLALLLSLCAAPAAAQPFLAHLPEVPLAPGLTELADAGFQFDTPEGRIAETVVAGQADAVATLTFYRETLRQLGWVPRPPPRALQPEVFAREGERLTLALDRRAPRLTLRLTVTPEKH